MIFLQTRCFFSAFVFCQMSAKMKPSSITTFTILVEIEQKTQK